MSEKEFELYLSLLSRFLRLKSSQRGEIADELRDHLEARLEELSRTGLSRVEAIHAALEEFGDATELAQHFTQIAQRRKRRFIMRCTVGTVAVLTAGILFSMAFWPANQAMQLPPAAIAQGEAKPDEAKKEEPKTAEPAPKVQHKAAAPGDGISPPRDERFRTTEEKLKTRVTLNFPDVPLQEAIEYISQLAKVDILIDKKSILDAGGDPEEIINWNLADYSLDTVLHLMLKPLNLDFHNDDGLIVIETAEKASNRMEVHVYNCRDLLAGVKDREEAVRNGVAGGGGMGGGGQRGGGGGFFQVADKPAATKAEVTKENGPAEKPVQVEQPATVRVSPEQSLMRVLMSSTNGPWEEVGGEGGTITAFDGLLVVRNNQQAQRDVQMVLDMLRAADKQIPAHGPNVDPLKGPMPAPVPPKNKLQPEETFGPEVPTESNDNPK